jgi:hypothetical protein
VSRFFFFLFFFTCTLVRGQESVEVLADTAVTEQRDSSATEEEEYFYEEEADEDVDLVAPPDSIPVSTRDFSQEQLEKLKSDPELQYEEVPTIAESLWDRFWMWIGQLLQSLFDNATGVNIGKILLYIVGIALLVVLIMMLLKVDAFKIFYSGQGAVPVRYNVIEENIHEMDFEALIQQAIEQKDYRRGVRLVFLYALKLLSDKHLIDWQQGKTNHDYVAELNALELKKGLNELSVYFDYAWYGNFNVSAEMFKKIQGIFTEWKANVR